MSTSTGPQRPVLATWKAALIACGRSFTSWTSHECLTIGIVMPVMSHSWKASVPMRCDRTCPVTQTSGVESIPASAIGVTRFVAPGPEVAKATPTRPEARAKPWAIWPAPCSWRATTCLIVVPRASASYVGRIAPPGIPNTVSTPSASRERNSASAPFINI